MVPAGRAGLSLSLPLVSALPAARVGHGGPWLLWRECGAALQQLDRDSVGRTNESHVPVARRAIDGNAAIHQLLANRVDIVDAIGKVAEIAPAGIGLRIPIEGEFHHRTFALARQIFITGCSEAYEREAALLVVLAVELLQAQQPAIESEAFVEVGDANHGVKVLHGGSLGLSGCET